MEKDKDPFAVVSAIFLLLWLFAFVQGVFVRSEVAISALEAYGYEHVHILDKAWVLVGLRGCGATDSAQFLARATSPLQRNVDVYVCVKLGGSNPTVLPLSTHK